jgi:hypothetical protein
MVLLGVLSRISPVGINYWIRYGVRGRGGRSHTVTHAVTLCVTNAVTLSVTFSQGSLSARPGFPFRFDLRARWVIGEVVMDDEVLLIDLP